MNWLRIILDGIAMSLVFNAICALFFFIMPHAYCHMMPKEIKEAAKPYIKKESMENQFCTDLYTNVGENIDVEGTTIHVFYAKKMEKDGKDKYLKRYKQHFKNPDIIEFDLQHEELLISYPTKWIEEIKKVTNIEEI